MVRLIQRVAILGALLLPFSFVPMEAGAVTSYYGSNYSYDYGTGADYAPWLGVHDGESDNNGAYAIYRRTSTGSKDYRLDDPNGSAAGDGNSPYGSRISQHHVCESQVGPDPCGIYVYP